MKVNATDFKNFLDEFLNLAKEQPVVIHKSGKPIAVVIGAAGYEYLQQLEDQHWVARAKEAEAVGNGAGQRQAVRILTECLKQDV